MPESTASLPPFPFFKEPEGLKSTLDDKDRNRNFDRAHMIAASNLVRLPKLIAAGATA